MHQAEIASTSRHYNGNLSEGRSSTEEHTLAYLGASLDQVHCLPLEMAEKNRSRGVVSSIPPEPLFPFLRLMDDGFCCFYKCVRWFRDAADKKHVRSESHDERSTLMPGLLRERRSVSYEGVFVEISAF